MRKNVNVKSVDRITDGIIDGMFPIRVGICTDKFRIPRKIKRLLRKELRLALKDDDKLKTVYKEFLDGLNGIKDILIKDVKFSLENDPAVTSEDEVICCYLGFYAVATYRIAHLLSTLKVPLLPRIMTEHAHSKTGIDIHPDAIIGEKIFIDHGTGTVIGQTATIGNGVKIYQGVTLGALSTKNAKTLKGKKRHPTIEDGVTIYANCTILGGNTIVGKNSVIGTGVVLTESVPKDSKVKKV